MARRKRNFLDDSDDSDGSGGSEQDDFNPNMDADAREEMELYRNPYKKKRQRRNGKDDATYGVFGEDSEDEGFSGRRGKGGKEKKSDWTKAPAFVSGKDKVKIPETLEVEEDGNSSEDDEEKEVDETADAMDVENEEDGEDDEDDEGDEGDEDEDDYSEPSKPPSPRVRDEDEDAYMDAPPTMRPRIGGIGFGGQSKSAFSGFGKGGIGSTFQSAGTSSTTLPSSSESTAMPPPPVPSQETAGVTVEATLPSAFGSSANRAQRSFVRSSAPTPTPRPANLSATDQKQFSALKGSFGSKMLEKMGWQAGMGLGTSGEGILTPVETKLRPQRAGIAFNNFKEKTEQSKAEARRRGEKVSDDEDDKPRKGSKKKTAAEKEKEPAWKRPKKVKTRIEHKTYEQIVAEAGEDTPASGIGQIIDATGATPREVASLADLSISSWTPSTDPTRIPEVRHNIRIIADECRSELDGLAREAKALEDRKKSIVTEDVRLRKKVEEEAIFISRLQAVHLVTDDITKQAQASASDYDATLDPFMPHIWKLLSEFTQEFERYRLDEIVVAAIAPTVRRLVSRWQPLEDPTLMLPTLRSMRGALKITEPEENKETQLDRFGTVTVVRHAPVMVEKPMTPFESLLWTVWLPKLRSAINNEWDPTDPQPAVKLYEAWASFLPPFIRDNVLDQLIIPKIQKTVASWNARGDVSLQSIVFPWLPHVGLRMEEFVADSLRKVKNMLRSWTVEDGVPKELLAWKSVFEPQAWDDLILKYIVPKLGATLRNDLQINPRDQNMTPIQRVVAWADILRFSVLSQLLETEFFPKWLEILHIWLIQPRVNFAEVAQWYEDWRKALPESTKNLDGFTRGLQLINKALELGPDAPSKLSKPDHPSFGAGTKGTTVRAPPVAQKSKGPSARAQEITFREIVEEYAAKHNLLLVPTGRAHELSRMPLFRVSKTADGKGGLVIYILDDAVWAPDKDAADSQAYRAISLEDMVVRANK